jgi:hypothetical protein
VSPTGLATFSGKTGDGVAVSFGSAVAAESFGTFATPFLVNTLGGKGFLVGGLRFTEGGATDTVAAVNFSRYLRPTSTGVFLPGGIQAALVAGGRTYVAPASGQRALGFLDGTNGAGKLTINAVAGEIGAVSENLTLSTRNTFTFASATRKPSLKLNAKSGLVSGSITEPAGRKRKLTGVLTVSGMTTIRGRLGSGRSDSSMESVQSLDSTRPSDVIFSLR